MINMEDSTGRSRRGRATYRAARLLACQKIVIILIRQVVPFKVFRPVVLFTPSFLI